MYLLILLFLNTLAILSASYFLPGVHVDGFWTAFMVSFVLGLVNVFLRPIIFILTLPINILTLGLFSFIIMGFMVYLVSQIVPGFNIDHFFWTIPFAFIASFFNWFFAYIFNRVMNQ
jgi:putative membrane protein